MAFETIAYSVDDGIARITLNRPERLNAINAQLISDLRDAVAAANDDQSVRVIVLSGAKEEGRNRRPFGLYVTRYSVSNRFDTDRRQNPDSGSSIRS